jgi:hypothetical protein
MDEAITTVFGSVIKSVDSLSRDNNKNQVKPLLDRRVDRIRLYMVKNDKKIQKAKEIMKKFNEAERKIKHDRKRRMREEAEKALGVNDSNNSINRSVAISGIDSINQSHLSSSSLSKTHESVISSSSYKKSVEPSPAISSRQSSYRRNDNVASCLL